MTEAIPSPSSDPSQQVNESTADSSVTAHAGNGGSAAGVTGDNVDAGAWPDDITPDRGDAAEGGAVAPPTSPQPEQAPMDDDAGGPTVPPPEESEAAKLGDFA